MEKVKTPRIPRKTPVLRHQGSLAGRPKLLGAATPELGALGDLLRARRQALGLTSEGLGKSCGMSAAQIYYVESGRHSPGYMTLVRLAAGLGLRIDFVEAKGDGN